MSTKSALASQSSVAPYFGASIEQKRLRNEVPILQACIHFLIGLFTDCRIRGIYAPQFKGATIVQD